MSQPDAAPILELIDAFRKSKTMFTALTLGVFDFLEHGPCGAAALAEATHTQVEPLERLLEACVSLGLLERTGEAFGNTEISKAYLVRSSPNTLSGYIKYSDEALYPMWANLSSAIREGTHRWQQTFGLSGNALFEHFFHTEEATRTFLTGMHGFGMLSSPAVVRAFDLSGFRHLVDLGGGTGHLAVAACEIYPNLRATVFDLPRVTAFARQMLATSSVSRRVDFQDGDFFHDLIPAADLYALGRILHDWAPERIKLLLARIHARLPAGGGLLIAEKLMDDDRGGPVPVHMQSLNMLVCTEGRERSLHEYRQLLQDEGFGSVQGVVTGQPLDAILAIRT
jgi:acetylserotonin N-methyltransferase